MRILVATSHRDIVGGVETYLHELLPSLRCRGHEVGLLHEYPATTAARIDGDATGGPSWCASGGLRAGLMRDIAAWRPDVVYCQGLADVGLEESLLGTFPSVLFAHGYYGTCISGQKCCGLVTTEPCERVLGPACLGLYFPRRCGGLNPVTMLRHYVLQRSRQALLSRYGAVLVASRHMHSEYANHGVCADRLHLVPLFAPGVVPDANPPAEKLRTDRVLFVGRLTDLKGGVFLVRAMAQAIKTLGRPLQLIVAGDGPQRENMAHLADRLGVAAEFHGWLEQSKCVALMREADVLAMPSIWPEPFGLVGLEAACVGLPAVAYGVGGIRDWLRPGESGELAPGDPPTVAGLAAALLRILADPAHRARLACGAWSVAQEFTRERHCCSVESHLESVAGATLVGSRT